MYIEKNQQNGESYDSYLYYNSCLRNSTRSILEEYIQHPHMCCNTRSIQNHLKIRHWRGLCIESA